MRIGELFLTSIVSGSITPNELEWVAKNQINFSSCEFDTALKLGQMVDSGHLNFAYSG